MRPSHGKASFLRKSFLGFVVVTLVVVAWGCSGYHPSISGSSTPTLTSIMVTAPLTSVVAGGTDQFTASGHYSDGSTQDLTSTATWNSTNTAAATISSAVGTQGLATGAAIGSTNITASLNGVTSSPAFSLTVTAAMLTSITVTAPLTSVVAGGSDQFTATGHYSDGSTQNLTSAATWNSTNTAAATISSAVGTQGLATGAAIGSTNITASLNGVTSSPAFSLTVTAAVLTSITVTAPSSSVAPGSTDQFIATGRYSDGSTQNLTSAATWNSSNTAAVTISNTAGTQGLATGVAIGSTNITASLNGVTSSPVFSLTVTAVVLTSITVAPPFTSATVGITDQFTATGHYSDRSTQNLTSAVTWNSSNAAALTISNTTGTQGLATHVAIGSTNVTASLNGVTSSPAFSLTVSAAVLTSITVTAPLTSVVAGGSDQFTATGHYSDGSTQDLTSVATWNSSNTAVATISNAVGTQGLATGVAIGSTNITASLNGVTSSPVFSLTVSAAVLTSITVKAPLSSVAAGITDQFIATGHYPDGSTQNLTSAATWNSSTAAATISNTAGTQGLATGVTIGSTNITASLNGVTSSPVFSLTVTAAVLTSITVTAPLTSVAPGSTDQFIATGRYSDGSTQNLTSAATWNSSNTAVATISNTAGTQGLATGVTIGSTNITASLNGVTSSADTLTVSHGFVPTGSLNVARQSHTATLLTNGTVLIAGGYDFNGNTSASAELYDPNTRLFTLTSNLKTARLYHSATLLNNGMVLIAGGATQLSGGQSLTSAELYDPVHGTFTSTGSMNFPRAAATATLLTNGKVLIAGGSAVGGREGGALASAELYDPTTGTFTLTGGMTTGRDYYTATLLNNGKVLIAGGFLDNFTGVLASAELYDPATGTFTPTGGMTTERAYHTATLLDNGTVLIAEGYNVLGNSSDSAELYDPGTGTFILTAAVDLSGGRFTTGGGSDTTTLLNNGMVLFEGNSALGIRSAWLYDPTTQRFSSAGILTDVIVSQTATRLNNGMVLIAGGYSNNLGIILASAELYEPDTLTPTGLVSIAVSPLDPTIPVGNDQRFVAIGTFSDRSTERLSSVTWSSLSSAVATVTSDASNHGAAHAVATGSATVSACDGSVCTSATLTVGVNGGVLTSITVTAPLSSVAAGITDQLTATGHYVDGSTQDLTSAATWNSSNTSAATISNTAGTQGLATSVAIGSTNITASLNGATSSPFFSLTVTAAVLTSITVTAPLSSVAPGITDQFIATGHYSDGSTQNLTSTATWNSSNTPVATISNTVGTNGLATGVAIGSTNITASINGVTSGADALTVAFGISFGLVSTGNLNTSRFGHTATLLTNGMVLIAGGSGGICCDQYGRYNVLASAELYDPPTGTFTPTGSMAAARYAHTATLLNNGTVLITGGFNQSYLSSAEIYDPASGTFTPAGSMINAREEHVAALLNNGKVLITGGTSNLGFIANAELYDPAAGTFTPTGSMTTARANLTATLLNNGKLLIAYSGSSELYDPATGTFTPTVSNVQSSGTAALLNNGMVLFMGGIGHTFTRDGNTLILAELYDPATDTFTPTGSANSGETATTLLNNGMVLFTAGLELYDPATGTFAPSGALFPGLYHHTTTLLSNGKVLIAGGFGGFSGQFFPFAFAHLYEPATLTPPGLVSIAVSPLTPTISPGTSRRLVATGTFSDNSTEQLASVTWSSSNTAVVTITNDTSNEGAAFGAALGTSTISACTGLVCGSTTLTVSGTGGVGAAASIAAAGGGGQSATVSTAFATPLQVIVEDASDNLVPNATVTFTAPAAGGSGTFANGTATTTAVTNSSGRATASPFTANSTSGAYSVTASVSGVSTTASFSLTNAPGVPASIVATGGGGQAATVAARFTTALQATVKDASGNLLPNATVTFTAPASGASGTFANGTATTMAVTNNSGIATASAFTANTTLGPYTVTASVLGVSTTANFSLTNITSAPASIFAEGGGGQSATVSTPFATALQAIVLDVSRNLVPNATVTFAAPTSGPSGTFANGTATTTAVTNSSGVATASAFTANSTPSAYNVTASVSGVSATASFSMANNPGPGSTALVVTETSASQPVLAEGAIVLVDGSFAGRINSSGSLTTLVTPGSHTVTILDLAGARGDVSVVAVAGMSTPMAVDVHESDATNATGSSNIPQIVGGVFDYTDATKNPITVQFLDATSNPVIVTASSSGYLRDNLGDVVDLSPYTTVTGSGALSVNLVSALQTLGPDSLTIAAKGPFLLEYESEDTNGVPYAGAQQFGLGIYSIAGTVHAPPSNLALPVGNVQLSFQNLSSEIVLQVTTGAGGAFTIRGVPAGSYNVQGSVTSGGITYTVLGTAVVQGNVIVSVVPLGPIDRSNNVVSVTTTPALGAALAPAISNKVASSTATPILGAGLAPAARPAQPRAAAGSSPSTQSTTVPSDGPYGPSITTPLMVNDLCNGPFCVPNFGDAVKAAYFFVPQGTQSADVVFQVCNQQALIGAFDQAQIVVVDANDNLLFYDDAYINQNETPSFLLQPNGCTAVLHYLMGVSALTLISPARLSLYIRSFVSAADEAKPVPTNVTAIITQPNVITSFTLDPIKPPNPSCTSPDATESSDTTHIEVCPSLPNSLEGIGDYVSIPSKTANNCFLFVTVGNCFYRPATAVLNFPADNALIVTNVRVDLNWVDQAGNILVDTIINQAPGQSVVFSDPKDPNKLHLSVGYLPSASPDLGLPSNLLNTSHPDLVSYVLTVTGTTTLGGIPVTATRNLSLSATNPKELFHTLWSAVNEGVPNTRYGKRDLGGDDWATENTILWLLENWPLITSFDDISGEHGRYIGHLEHGTGTDIDIFQFLQVCKCTKELSGTENYHALENATIAGFHAILLGANNLSPLKILTDYVVQNRAGIDALRENPKVTFTMFGEGAETQYNPEGWLMQAMCYGTLPLKAGPSTTLPLGNMCSGAPPLPNDAVDLLDVTGKKIGPWKPANQKPIAFNRQHNSHVHIRLKF